MTVDKTLESFQIEKKYTTVRFVRYKMAPTDVEMRNKRTSSNTTQRHILNEKTRKVCNIHFKK